MRRRGLVLGSAAAVAVAAGAGVAWWRGRDTLDVAEAVDVAEALDSLQLQRPEGGEWRPEAQRGRPRLINFWATWCAPCVAELPMLDRFASAHPSWQVFGLAVDRMTPVREFLARHAVSYPIGITGADGIDLARRLGNAAGGLPFSIVLTSRGTVAVRKLGAIVSADLVAWSRDVV